MQKLVDGEIVDMSAEEMAELAAMEAASPVLPPLTMRQFRLGLLDAGLLDDVEAAIAAMTGDAKKRAEIEWEHASKVVRNAPLVSTLAAALSLTDEQVDALWLSAMGL